ncbi:MAG: adenylate/guanylate cyclase domain-containing protein [Saprospiraceae bacterium]|nr:adenylate/guanylate cyclase domain-containing protein [Saprospiraceae bacterium]
MHSNTSALTRVAPPLEQFKSLIAMRSRPGGRHLDDITGMFDPGVTGFGTAPHEIFRSVQDIFRQLDREARYMPNGFGYKFHWVEEQRVSADTSIITSEIRITIPLTDRTLIFDPVRLSAVYHLQGDAYKLVHWHTSFPDNSDTDEVFPGALEPQRYDDVTVIFTDLVGFTRVATETPPEVLVAELSALFVTFDALTAEFGLDKIKTIGDSYMVASGLCQQHDRPAVQAVRWAQAAMAGLNERSKRGGLPWQLRIGMHTGPVIGGVLGTHKLSFDLWGDTVNVAKRIESNSRPNRINVSDETYRLIADVFPGELQGCCTVKGKREVEMYLLKTEPTAS